MNTFSTFITDLIAMAYIFTISNQIFLILLLIKIFFVMLIYYKNKFDRSKNIEYENAFYSFFSNINFWKNNGKEVMFHSKLIDGKIERLFADNFDNTLDFISKTSTLLIYFISWHLLKNNTIDFNSFFIILILKSFNRSFVFSLNNVFKNWTKYLSFKSKMQNAFKTELRKIELEEVKSVSYQHLSSDSKIELAFPIHSCNNLINLKVFNKTFKDNKFTVLINNKNINFIDEMNLRKKVIYINGSHIFFGTIHQNIIINASSENENILSYNLVSEMLNKYKIKLENLVEPNSYSLIEKEFITLLSIFYNEAQLILLDYNFQLIEKNDLELILNLFKAVIRDKFLILP